MAISAEHRSKFAALVTSPNGWKILKWNEKLEKKNQTDILLVYLWRNFITKLTNYVIWALIASFIFYFLIWYILRKGEWRIQKRILNIFIYMYIV